MTNVPKAPFASSTEMNKYIYFGTEQSLSCLRRWRRCIRPRYRDSLLLVLLLLQVERAWQRMDASMASAHMDDQDINGRVQHCMDGTRGFRRLNY